MLLPNLNKKSCLPLIHINPSTTKARFHFPIIKASRTNKKNITKTHDSSIESDSLSLFNDDSLSKASVDDSDADYKLKGFANQYKKQLRLNDRNQNSKNKKLSGTLAYINSASLQNLLPRAAGLMNVKENNRLNLKDYNLGDKYASALSQGIHSLDKLEILDLSSNRLSNKGAIEILRKLPDSIKVLDFTNNKSISYPTIQQACTLLGSSTIKIHQLSIENTQCSDRGAILIADALKYNNILTSLNISKCEISDNGAMSIADMLEGNNILLVLILHWNKIGFKGGSALARSLVINETLRVFDASFNHMDSTETCYKFKEVFSANRSLVHVDLSNNCFKADSIKIMSISDK